MMQLSWNIRLEDFTAVIEVVSLVWLMQIILRAIQFRQQFWLFLIFMLIIVKVVRTSLMSSAVNMRLFLNIRTKIMQPMR
mgnify:CR=1 FL=1